MPTCKDCIHYDICIFHLKGNENEECVRFINTADVVPRNEIAREIFEEIERETKNHGICYTQRKIAELKKKYTGGENNEV